MKKQLITISALACLLSGCASVNSYQEPSTNAAKAATVSGSSTRNGLFNWTSTSISSIDNKGVGMLWSENSKIRVNPGTHRFVLNSGFNQNFGGGGPYESFTEVSASVLPGHNYQFVSKVDGATMKVWAVDDNGRVASSVGSSNYKTAPREVIVPIIVPTR